MTTRVMTAHELDAPFSVPGIDRYSTNAIPMHIERFVLPTTLASSWTLLLTMSLARAWEIAQL